MTFLLLVGYLNRESSDNSVNSNILNCSRNHNRNDNSINDIIKDSLSVTEISCDEKNTTSKSLDINQKIRQWVLKNLGTLRLNVVTELLLLLRDEGFTTLPKTGQTLLGTTHYRTVQVMSSFQGTDGSYAYLGIKHGLKKIIPVDYKKREIKIFIHSDGMHQQFKHTSMAYSC